MYDAKGLSAFGEQSLTCQTAFMQCLEADSVGRRLGTRMSFAGLRPESMTAGRRSPVVLDRQQFAKIRELVEGEEAHTAPGLQMQPDATLFAPAEGAAGAHHRMDVLHDWGLVRVYPSGHPHGVIGRVRDPTGLRELVSRSESPP